MINIVEILKDCPKGTKLYSPLCGDCELNISNKFITVISRGREYTFDKYGCFIGSPECLLFPSRENRDWTKFRPFKDGDILTYTSKYTTTFIYRNKDNEPFATSFYVACNDALSHNFLIYNKYTLIALNENCDVRLATEDEKIKLFDAIKTNGYKWNAETKTLEKLEQPKFHEGDLITIDKPCQIYEGDWITIDKTCQIIDIDYNGNYLVQYCDNAKTHVLSKNFCESHFHLWTIKDAKDGDVIFYEDGWTCIFKCIHGIWYSSYCFITSDGEFHTGYETHAIDSIINGNANLATKEQCNLLFQKMKEAGYKWNAETKTLEKLVEPNFKDGDIISNILTNSICIFKGEGSINGTVDFYCGICCNEFFIKDNIDPIKHFGYIKSYHLATEKEKQKFFDVIKSNGYKWNSETKTLERCPKFKVGDRIKRIKTGNIYEIIKIIPNYYITRYLGSDIMISFDQQDEYYKILFD